MVGLQFLSGVFSRVKPEGKRVQRFIQGDRSEWHFWLIRCELGGSFGFLLTVLETVNTEELLCLALSLQHLRPHLVPGLSGLTG